MLRGFYFEGFTIRETMQIWFSIIRFRIWALLRDAADWIESIESKNVNFKGNRGLEIMAFENGVLGKNVGLGSKKPVEELPNGRRLVGAEARNLETFAQLKKEQPDTILEADDFVSH